MTTTIRLEIWIGNEYDSGGHEQELSIGDLLLLKPVIKEEALNHLIDEYVSRTAGNN